VVSVAIHAVPDLGALGERWRDLEQRSDGSFFQSWTWTGCLVEERFPNPVLVEATDAGRTVALGLFNRVGRRLYLGESGSPDLDCPYVEQNGILTEDGRQEELTALCLRALIRRHDLVLSGVGEATVAALGRSGGLMAIRSRQESPFVDLAAIRAGGGDFLAGRSANTRQQIRRSDRYYGAIALECAATAQAAHAMLDQLALLHQAAWRARGRPGSFASSFFGRFHHALIDRGFARGEIALEQVSSNGTIIGFLYNFVWRRQMLAYQSGFAYRNGESHARPGLSSHHAAIRDALAKPLDRYDFLAGGDRYKRSMADRAHSQFWMEAGPLWSPRLLFRRLSARLR
jgi:CelD/BcsL family acetyltransferase involved in cellulose biosynthesis